MIRVDNGPKFISKVIKDWAKKHQILLHYIQPGKPAQNAFIERFNRTYRGDVLDMNLFSNLSEVREITEHWLVTYNNDRLHEALAGLSLYLFAGRRAELMRINEGENSILN